ncbi:PGPGW domain-containing protein [Shewanella gelidii]|uniref:Tellurium resistance protein TerC n=1 Tax=Shewanella gelidii TaxID=1642821 RepID=A0A917JQD2_9GAMM|nr:PGPGW domain-containing protein [Shewanella gelidii]MCL1099231.1 PGPGW domain-containing protein [Shewanella gelidii]GGI76628.1 hypothetical protein GCM10009332_12490 [Shewanella gelidii]
MKKTTITLVGGTITILGLILIIVPGPAWLLLPIGLAILSIEYPWAKKWLKKSQRHMKESARWLDDKIAKLKKK